MTAPFLMARCVCKVKEVEEDGVRGSVDEVGGESDNKDEDAKGNGKGEKVG